MSGSTASSDEREVSGHVVVELEDGVAIVRLNRPDKLNALSLAMLTDIGAALDRHGRDGAASGIVLTGTGRAFSAGDDLPATDGFDEASFEVLLDRFQGLTRSLLATEVPVVAALNGIAVGGAAELALACDARVGFPGSDFLFPENEVGLTISNAASYLLPRAIGSRALPIVLDARRIAGTEAHVLGLIDRMTETAEDVLPSAIALLRGWIERGLATRWHLKLLRPRIEEIEAAIAREDEMGRQAWRSGAPSEGIRRFMAEREARRTR